MLNLSILKWKASLWVVWWQQKIIKYHDLSAEAENYCHAWSSSILNLDTDKPESEVQICIKSRVPNPLQSWEGKAELCLTITVSLLYVMPVMVHSVKGVCSIKFAHSYEGEPREQIEDLSQKDDDWELLITLNPTNTRTKEQTLISIPWAHEELSFSGSGVYYFFH